MDRADKIGLVIMDAVARMPNAGITRVTQMLAGSRAREIIAGGYETHRYYGRLSDFTQSDIRHWISELFRAGYLVLRGGEYPTVHLTPAGRAALQARTPVTVGARATRAERQLQRARCVQGPSTTAPTTPVRLAADGLIERLRDPSAEVRRLAVRALGASGTPGATEALLTFIGEQPPPDLILAAIRALGQIGGATGRQALAKVAGDETLKAYVRLAARQVLRSADVRADTSSVIAREDGTQQTETVTRTTLQDEAETIDLAARIETFLSRPHHHLLQGPWDLGWALDHHGRHMDGHYGHTAVGRAVEQLKYRQRAAAIGPIRDTLRDLLATESDLARVDLIVPVPSTERRAIDPVTVLADTAGELTGLRVEPLLAKTRATHPQKDLHTLAEKRRNVQGAFGVSGAVRGRAILVVDDLCDSGETLKEVTGVLRRAGATRVHVLTATRTIHTEG
jgi:adenine/guanine phosphoribosyltransferase-like PRPP-binding protein